MSSSTSTSGSRISMFAAKSGFVIPKNKLSGSLVPAFKGKPGGNETCKEQNTNQAQKKSKWGPDLTQDPAVKKGRALAYQKRVEQITQLLESGTLELRNDQDSTLATQNALEKSSDSQVESKKVELLELEKREAIGEILKLNPRYKAPPDYKPLMKEARVPIPVQEYPEYNFFNLILGPRGDNQKRLEKETGAKIQVYGNKASSGEKVEISPHDGNEILGACEELYVKVSAETYEKVDAAVAVIELLITSVSGNLGAASASACWAGDDSSVPSKNMDTVTDPSSTELVDTTQNPQNKLQLNDGPWFPPLNSSAPNLSNPIQGQPFPSISSNMPSFAGYQQGGQNLQITSLPPSSQSAMQVWPRPFAPESLPMGNARPTGTFPMPASIQSDISGPTRPSLPFLSQTSFPSRPRPLSDLVSSNMGQMARPLVPNFGPRPATLQPGNAQPPISFHSSVPVNSPSRPTPDSAYGSLPTVHGSLPWPRPAMVGHSSSSASVSNPPTSAAPRPSFVGDFTFQPHRLNNTVPSQMSPRPNIQAPRSMLQPPPAVNLSSRPVIQTFSRPQQLDLIQTHVPSPFPGNPRSHSFQNVGPLASQIRPSNLGPVPQMPNLDANFRARQVNPMLFRQNHPTPYARPQNQQFNTIGQQVYDPFSPTDT